MEDLIKTVAVNKAAYHEYFVIDKFEVGAELCGTEVKSIRAGRVNLKDSFCRIENGELFAYGIHISPYEKGNIYNRDPYRVRKLLMHRREIDRLFGAVGQKGYSVIPLSMYFRNKWVKLEIGLCKGKKLYDKRESAAEKTMKRDIERAEKGNY